jgi:hypothetical protein
VLVVGGDFVKGGRLPSLDGRRGVCIRPPGEPPLPKRTPELGDACGLASGTWAKERLAPS